MSTRWFQRVIVIGLLMHLLSPVSNAEVDISAYALKAEQALKQGKYRRAEMYYTRIVRALPESTDYRIHLGMLQLLRGKLSEARKQGEAVLERDPVHRDGLLLMSRLSMREQAWEEAYNYLQTLVTYYPDEAEAYLSLASLYSSWRDDKSKTAFGDEKAEALALERYRELIKASTDNHE